MNAEPKKNILKIFFGEPRITNLPLVFTTPEWVEHSVDITSDAKNNFRPQIKRVSQMGKNSFDTVIMQHILPRFTINEAIEVVEACKSVLKEDGVIYLTTFDVQKIGDYISQGKVDEKIFEGKLGIVTAIDAFFGHRSIIANGNVSAMHKSAYVSISLGRLLKAAGFFDLQVKRDKHELIGVAKKGKEGMINIEEKIKIIDPELMQQPYNIETAPVQWQPLNLNLNLKSKSA